MDYKLGMRFGLNMGKFGLRKNLANLKRLNFEANLNFI